jgi:hypothetical protein
LPSGVETRKAEKLATVESQARYDKAATILEAIYQPPEFGRTLMLKVGFLLYLKLFGELFGRADRVHSMAATRQ